MARFLPRAPGAHAKSARRKRASARLVSVRIVRSGARRRGEEAAPTTVRPAAAPEGAVGRRLGFAEWNDLAVRQAIAGLRFGHALDDEAVAGTAAPLAGRVLPFLMADPKIMRMSAARQKGEDGDKHAEQNSHDFPSG